MIAVKGADKRVRRDPGARYAKLLETHRRMEAELSRALNRWQKSRKALWAAEKRLDKEFAERADRAATDTPFDDIDQI